MARGVGRVVSARSWGRAGIAALVLAGCGTAAVPPATVAAPRALPAAAPAGPSTTPAAFTPAPVPLAPTRPPAATGAGVWAVVVGVDDYPGVGHDLRSARNDAADVDAALARYGVPGDHRVGLIDGRATAVAIDRALDWLVAHAGPDATAVFFFAGHVRKLGPTTEAMVGADDGLVTDIELAGHLAHLRARRSWLVVAGCYGGGFTEALAPGRILTAAAAADRVAYESTALHRSYLVEYLVRRAMLEGRAATSVEAAFAWAAAALRHDHPGRVPVQYDDLDGDLVLGPAPPATAGPPPVPVPTGRPSTPTTSTPPAPSQRRQCILTFGSSVHCPDD